MADKLQQGNLDRGCGFYSVLNAISEVNGMSLDRSIEIFAQFSKTHPDLASSGYLRGLFFTDMRDKVIPAIIDLLDADEKVTCTFPFKDMKFASVEQYAERLRGQMGGTSCAVVGFGYPWNHWTAATNVTEHAIILKDSTDHHRKMISSLALATNDGEYQDGTVIHSRQTAVFSK